MAHSNTSKSNDAAGRAELGERDQERTALMKSLEYLYGEAARADLALVANLIGAAVEAIRDELDGPAGIARARVADLSFSFPDFSSNRLLTDNIDIDDEDFFDDES
jgi:hypothetical protein